MKNAFFVWTIVILLLITTSATAAGYFKPAGGTIKSVSGITCGSGTIFTTSFGSGYFWVSSKGKVVSGKKILGVSKTQNSSVCYTDGENPTSVTVNVVEPYGVSR